MRTNIVLNTAWDAWLWEPIHSGWGDAQSEDVPREVVLHTFLKEGLLPFLASKKYRIACEDHVFCSRIATGLFKNRNVSSVSSEWRFGLENTDYSPEDLDHYYMVLSQDVWDSFWAVWGQWGDVSPDAERGIDRRNDIQAYIWTQLDLRASGQTAVLEAEHGILEEEEWGRSGQKGQDYYIREASESNEWGGYRR